MDNVAVGLALLKKKIFQTDCHFAAKANRDFPVIDWQSVWGVFFSAHSLIYVLRMVSLAKQAEEESTAKRSNGVHINFGLKFAFSAFWVKTQSKRANVMKNKCRMRPALQFRMWPRLMPCHAHLTPTAANKSHIIQCSMGAFCGALWFAAALRFTLIYTHAHIYSFFHASLWLQ